MLVNEWLYCFYYYSLTTQLVEFVSVLVVDKSFIWREYIFINKKFYLYKISIIKYVLKKWKDMKRGNLHNFQKYVYNSCAHTFLENSY